MCQKWEGDCGLFLCSFGTPFYIYCLLRLLEKCGLWVPNEIIFKKYAESLKKVVGAVWELPAK